MKQSKKNKKERNQRKGKKKQSGKLIKDKIIKDIRSPFEEEEEDYSKPKRGSSFWNNNYIEYKSNGDKNSNLSLDKYRHKVKAYLRDIIVDF